MKKQISLFLCLSAALLFCACSAAAAASAAPSPSLAAASGVKASVGELAAPSPSVAPTVSATAAPTPSPDVTPTEAEATDTTLDDGPEKYVSAAFYDSGEYIDRIDNKFEYVLAIPMLNSDNGCYDKLNAEIYDMLYPYVDEVCRIMEDGYSLFIENIDYELYLNGDVLSIVSRVDYCNDFTFYRTWNVDINKQTELSDKALFALTSLGADGSSLADITAGTAGRYYAETFTDYNTRPWREFYDNTMSEENLSQTQYYFNDDSSLIGIVKIFVPVGGGEYSAHIEIKR